MKYPLLALLPLAGAAAGCAVASPVIRLTPDDPHVTWVSGMGIFSAEAEGLQVAAAFALQQDDRIAVRLEVQNSGDRAVTVEPRGIFYKTCARRTEASCSRSAFVLDPEKMLIDLELAGGQERAAAINSAAFGTALLLLDTVAVLGNAASGKGRAAARAADTGAAIAGTTVASLEQHEQGLTALEIERQNLATQALRLTTLAPGQGMAGLVYMPADFRAAALRLYVDIGGLQFRFPFLQTVYGYDVTPPEAPSPRDSRPAGPPGTEGGARSRSSVTQPGRH
jgi:hypothetical protein